MPKIKCLITTGCSFTQVPNTADNWPVHLQEYIQADEVQYLGQGAAGNGIISRKTIHAVAEALKKYSSDEILVGVMWSGFDRGDVFSLTNLDHSELSFTSNYENPLQIVGGKDYYITNTHWSDLLTKDFYNPSYRSENQYLITLEHVLRTQLFLDKVKVKYFMTEYCDGSVSYNKFQSKDIEFFYSLIDKTYWLPIDNMYAWCSRTDLPFARPNDNHPGSAQNYKMVYEELIPFLLEKKLIDQ